jgi:hypothetical protein
MLGRLPASAVAEGGETACARADAASAKQAEELRKIKKERFSILEPGDLKPWIEKVKKRSAQTRAATDKAVQICTADKEIGPRARQAALSRLKKRARELDETDEQMAMLRAFEKDPYPRIDPSVLRVLER